MARELDLTVLGGLPITVEYEGCSAEPDVGLPNDYVADWYIVAINGRAVKKCDWLYRRIKANGEESTVLEACEEAWREAAYEYDDY